MAEKKIKELSIDGLRNEIKKYCDQQVKNGSCGVCVLSGIRHLDDINTFHKPADDIDDRYTLGLMVALIRGYLVWSNRKEFDNGSNVPDQPTIPPMPEPVELPEAKVSELSVDVSANVPDDMTVIMISGKKPAMMTTYFDQPAD